MSPVAARHQTNWALADSVLPPPSFRVAALTMSGLSGRKGRCSMLHSNRGFETAIAAALTLFVTTAPGLGADLGPEPRYELPQPAPPLNQWQFSFTPYL